MFCSRRLCSKGFLAEVSPSSNLPTGIKTGVSTPAFNGRQAHIYKRGRNAMTSGTAGTEDWNLDFTHLGHWKNDMIGYHSTKDPLGQLRMIFETKQAAINFAEKNGWAYSVQEPEEKKRTFKAYETKFKWRGVPKKPEDDI